MFIALFVAGPIALFILSLVGVQLFVRPKKIVWKDDEK
jgi:hypothetical protein